MRHNHSFSQRNNATEKAMGVGVGGDREERGGVGQNLKKGEQAIQGRFHKIGWVRTPLPSMIKKEMKTLFDEELVKFKEEVNKKMDAIT